MEIGSFSIKQISKYFFYAFLVIATHSGISGCSKCVVDKVSYPAQQIYFSLPDLVFPSPRPLSELEDNFKTNWVFINTTGPEWLYPEFVLYRSSDPKDKLRLRVLPHEIPSKWKYIKLDFPSDYISYDDLSNTSPYIINNNVYFRDASGNKHISTVPTTSNIRSLLPTKHKDSVTPVVLSYDSLEKENIIFWWDTDKSDWSIKKTGCLASNAIGTSGEKLYIYCNGNRLISDENKTAWASLPIAELQGYKDLRLYRSGKLGKDILKAQNTPKLPDKYFLVNDNSLVELPLLTNTGIINMHYSENFGYVFGAKGGIYSFEKNSSGLKHVLTASYCLIRRNSELTIHAFCNDKDAKSRFIGGMPFRYIYQSNDNGVTWIDITEQLKPFSNKD